MHMSTCFVPDNQGAHACQVFWRHLCLAVSLNCLASPHMLLRDVQAVKSEDLHGCLLLCLRLDALGAHVAEAVRVLILCLHKMGLPRPRFCAAAMLDMALI